MENKTAENDTLFILEDEKNFEKSSKEVEQLLKEFSEELRPLGIACKTWGKTIQ